MSAAGESIRLPFADRAAAGEALAACLAQRPHLRLHPSAVGPVLVLALPRGGVPVAAAVARVLHAPLDLLLVRKIGAPGQPELAVAALVDGTPPQVVANRPLCRRLGIGEAYLAAGAHDAIAENERRRRRYLGGRPAPDVAGRCVVVVDDGVATGTTMLAALQALRAQRPRHLVAAVPVASCEAAAALRPLVDEWVCLAEPVPFEAVGRHYRHFEQVDDDEVVQALAEAAAGARSDRPLPETAGRSSPAAGATSS